MAITGIPASITGYKEPKVVQEIDPSWAAKPWTLRKSVALIAWWLMCLILPPIAIIISGISGGIYGCARGMIKGAVESYKDLRQWWEMFENIDQGD